MPRSKNIQQTPPSKYTRQRGFTFLELTTSIAMLGVLSSTALTKFADLEGDTRAAVLNGVSAALNTATTFTHLQASLQNKLANRVQTIDFSGEAVTVKNGFPIADWASAIHPIMLMNAAEVNSDTQKVCSGFDFCASSHADIKNSLPANLTPNSDQLVVIWMQGYQLSDHCFAYFHNPDNSNMPISATVTTGC